MAQASQETIITNDNIRKLVRYYPRNKSRLPLDLRDKHIGDILNEIKNV